MLARTDSRARALFLLMMVAIVSGLIGIRLAQWQVVEAGWLAEQAAQQWARNESIPAARGDIYDATGGLLATTIQVPSVYATPPKVEDPRHAAQLLSVVLALDQAELYARLSSDDPWTWLKRRVDSITAARIEALGLSGVGMLPELKRFYPLTGVAEETTLAAQLLGYVNIDGVGQYGVEGANDPLLAGEPGWVSAQEDVAGRQIADSVYELVPPLDGADLTLTLDAGLQHLLEQEMWGTYQRNYAHGATGIVMDVQTGAILALASFPTFDANAYGSADPALFALPAVSRQYEPGSTMKAFTVAAALEAGAIELTTTVEDDNNLRLAGYRIQNADRYRYPYGHGPLTPGDVLMLSNNVGAAKIGLLLGREELYHAFLRFGFGAPTGVDISGEASGVVWDPDGPNGSGDLTAAQNSFGQGLSVTALQMVAGYAAFANGGTLVTPHLVAGWTDADGVYHAVETPEGERIMRADTAATVLRLLTDAVDHGIAQKAAIPGYSIAGKTGTAQIAGPVTTRRQVGTDADGQPIYTSTTTTEYISDWIDASFISIMPASQPRLVTMILIHRPAVWGRYQTAQSPDWLFRDLAPRLLDYLAIPPDRELPAVAAP